MSTRPFAQHTDFVAVVHECRRPGQDVNFAANLAEYFRPDLLARLRADPSRTSNGESLVCYLQSRLFSWEEAHELASFILPALMPKAPPMITLGMQEAARIIAREREEKAREAPVVIPDSTPVRVERMSPEQIAEIVPHCVPFREVFLPRLRAGVWTIGRVRSELREHVKQCLSQAAETRERRTAADDLAAHYGVPATAFKQDYSGVPSLAELLRRLQSKEGGGLLIAWAVRVALHFRPELVAMQFGLR